MSAEQADRDFFTGAELRECAICHDYTSQGVEVHDICVTRLLDERDAAIRRAEDLRAVVELCDQRVHDSWGKDGMADFYTFRAADWNRVLAVARGHLSEAALRELTNARAALRSQESQKPPETVSNYTGEGSLRANPDGTVTLLSRSQPTDETATPESPA